MNFPQAVGGVSRNPAVGVIERLYERGDCAAEFETLVDQTADVRRGQIAVMSGIICKGGKKCRQAFLAYAREGNNCCVTNFLIRMDHKRSQGWGCRRRIRTEGAKAQDGEAVLVLHEIAKERGCRMAVPNRVVWELIYCCEEAVFPFRAFAVHPVDEERNRIGCHAANRFLCLKEPRSDERGWLRQGAPSLIIGGYPRAEGAAVVRRFLSRVRHQNHGEPGKAAARITGACSDGFLRAHFTASETS